MTSAWYCGWVACSPATFADRSFSTSVEPSPWSVMASIISPIWANAMSG